MRAININSQQWTRFTIPANTNFALITQEQAVCYYAEQNDPADFFQFKEIVGNLPQEREIWLKTQYGESVVLYVENISTIAGFGGSGGGGGGSYAFSAPLNESGGNVSLNLANDLQVSGDRLALNLQNNSEFSSLSSLVQSLTSGVEIIGQIPKPNAEVSVDTNLLTLFVDTEKGRAPRGGDVILTTEANSNPSYVWLYTSTGVWAGIGTAGAGIATQATLGLIKGSSTISIANDGTASVNGVALLSGNNTFAGSNTFPDATTTSNPLTFSTLFKDSTFTPTTSNIPNGGGVFVMN